MRIPCKKVYFLFRHRLDLCKDGGECKVDKRDLYVERQRLVGAGDNSLRCHEHFCNSYICGKRSLLYHCDKRVGQRRKCSSKCLGKHNP